MPPASTGVFVWGKAETVSVFRTSGSHHAALSGWSSWAGIRCDWPRPNSAPPMAIDAAESRCFPTFSRWGVYRSCVPHAGRSARKMPVAKAPLAVASACAGQLECDLRYSDRNGQASPPLGVAKELRELYAPDERVKLTPACRDSAGGEHSGQPWR